MLAGGVVFLMKGGVEWRIRLCCLDGVLGVGG